MKQFFKFMFASTLGTVIGFVLVIFLSVIVMAGIVSSVMMSSKNSGENVTVKDNSILVIDMEDELVERKKLSPFEGIEIEGLDDNSGMETKAFLAAIQAAKTDDKIKGIMLKGKYFNGSLSTITEVREALMNFQDGGKFVLAYDEVYTQSAYYLASAASEVYMFQEGMIELHGLRTELAFFKNTMEKMGIGATVLMGPDNIYKSAIEPFTRDDMSEPNKVQIQRILDVVWLKMTTDIAASRNITTEQINSIANELKVRKPEDAVTLGLLDGVVYYDQILENLRGKLGLEADGEIESVSIKDYVNSKSGGAKKSTDDKSWELKDEVAVIYAVGGINSGEGDDENIGSETLAKAIREARTNEDVKAIVMRVVSPGGSAMASDVIWREAKLAAETKPFVVSFGSVAASGGYYISTHAKRIFANENTITGSIGVFGIIPDARELLTEKMGITFDGVKTNAHADFGSMKHGFDEAELTLLSEYVSETYREFVSRVAEGRGMTYEEVDSIARGRVWIGADAISIGLVDEIGGMDDAIAYAAKEAGLESYDLIELPKQKDPWESFFEDLSGNAKAQVGNWVFGNEYEWVKKVEELKTMQGIQTRMMFDIKVN